VADSQAGSREHSWSYEQRHPVFVGIFTVKGFPFGDFDLSNKFQLRRFPLMELNSN
jgi:hypothetical protein